MNAQNDVQAREEQFDRMMLALTGAIKKNKDDSWQEHVRKVNDFVAGKETETADTNRLTSDVPQASRAATPSLQKRTTVRPSCGNPGTSRANLPAEQTGEIIEYASDSPALSPDVPEIAGRKKPRHWLVATVISFVVFAIASGLLLMSGSAAEYKSHPPTVVPTAEFRLNDVGKLSGTLNSKNQPPQFSSEPSGPVRSTHPHSAREPWHEWTVKEIAGLEHVLVKLAILLCSVAHAYVLVRLSFAAIRRATEKSAPKSSALEMNMSH